MFLSVDSLDYLLNTVSYFYSALANEWNFNYVSQKVWTVLCLPVFFVYSCFIVNFMLLYKKSKLDSMTAFLSSWKTSEPRTVTVSSHIHSRWWASSLQHVPADTLQPWGITTPPAWGDVMGSFQIDAFLWCYLFVCEFLAVWGRDTASFSRPPSRWWCRVWSIEQSQGSAKTRETPDHTQARVEVPVWWVIFYVLFCTCDWADWEIGRADGQTEYRTVRHWL